MSDYNQEESVVGRVITGCAAQLAGAGRNKDEIIAELGALAAGAQVVWRTLYPPQPKDPIDAPVMYGGEQHGVPVLNKPAEPTPYQQAHTSPVATPAGALPWDGNFHPNISPASMDGNPKWMGYAPFKGKQGSMCAESGMLWSETTYAMLLNRMTPILDEKGKPRYGTAWGTLAWLIETSDPTNPQYGKNNTYKVAQCKAVMLEVARRQPPQGYVKPIDRGPGGTSVQETEDLMRAKGFVPAVDRPAMPEGADNNYEGVEITPF
jgi:hypothetical protein